MTLKRWLQIFFILVLVGMTWVTVRASLHQSVVDAAGPLIRNPWGLATLFDAYFGFLTFYLWLAYKEQRWWPRIYWLVLILFLGNFAMAGYVLKELARADDRNLLPDLLSRRNA